MNKTLKLTTFALVSTGAITTSHSALIAGDAIGLDFGTAVTDANFNAIAVTTVTDLDAISVGTGAVTGTLFSLSSSSGGASTFTGNDGAHQGPTAPTDGFTAAQLNDWNAAFSGTDVWTYTFTGLDNSLSYDISIAIGHSTDANTTGGSFGGDLSGSIAIGANSTATHISSFTGLTTGGDGTISFTYGDVGGESSIAPGFSALRISAVAVPEPSSTALFGLAGLALILRRRR